MLIANAGNDITQYLTEKPSYSTYKHTNNDMRTFPPIVLLVYGVIITVSKQVIAYKSPVSPYEGYTICAYKSPYLGIIVSASQIIESCLRVIIVSPVSAPLLRLCQDTFNCRFKLSLKDVLTDTFIYIINDWNQKIDAQ